MRMEDAMLDEGEDVASLSAHKLLRHILMAGKGEKVML